MTIENVVDEAIVDAIDDSRNIEDTEMVIATIKPYAAHVVVNNMLKSNGFDQKIPPQMMYNYKASQYCPFVVVDGEFTVESFKKWLEKYIDKKIAKRAAEAK